MRRCSRIGVLPPPKVYSNCSVVYRRSPSNEESLKNTSGLLCRESAPFDAEAETRRALAGCSRAVMEMGMMLSGRRILRRVAAANGKRCWLSPEHPRSKFQVARYTLR